VIDQRIALIKINDGGSIYIYAKRPTLRPLQLARMSHIESADPPLRSPVAVRWRFNDFAR
jgi:hypothetical protein